MTDFFKVLQNKPRLLVFSSCESRELIGMISKETGISCIGSKFKVIDKENDGFIEPFYLEILKGNKLSNAVKLANSYIGKRMDTDYVFELKGEDISLFNQTTDWQARNQNIYVVDRQINALVLLEQQLGTSIPWANGNSEFGFIAKNGEITNLNLRGRKIKSVPDAIGTLSSLEELDLSSNQLTSLPSAIGNITSLKVLRVNNNSLVHIPESIGNLISLEIIQFEDNRLETLPEQLGHLASLRVLWLQNNLLEFLPHTLGDLKSLQWLYLSHNRLTHLPMGMGKLSSLLQFRFDDNQISALPEDFSKLSSLEYLDYFNNESLSFSTIINEWISFLKKTGCRINQEQDNERQADWKKRESK